MLMIEENSGTLELSLALRGDGSPRDNYRGERETSAAFRPPTGTGWDGTTCDCGGRDLFGHEGLANGAANRTGRLAARLRVKELDCVEIEGGRCLSAPVVVATDLSTWATQRRLATAS